MAEDPRTPEMPPPYVHPTADVDSSAEIGSGTRIWHRVHVREKTRIGSQCTVSKDVYVDAGVVIGDRVKIQNGVSVYHGVTVEDDVFLGPHMAFTNDETPRAFSTDWKVVPTLVRRGASIGANATIVCGVTIGPYAMVAAGATVTNDVPPHALVIGSPARVVAYICRNGHRMRSLADLDYQCTYRCDRCDTELRVTFTLDEHPPSSGRPKRRREDKDA
jgi:UDP-2-acetamido-3-amino-2,3-dideoxy-glucuronate N-acetyltransferase